MRILLIANYVKGHGGISVQVELLRDLLREDGVDVDIFTLKGSFLYRLLSPARLLSVGRKYDVFHIHACSYFGFLPAIVGIFVGRLLKKRILLTYHGGDLGDYIRKYKLIVKPSLLKTDANIVLSQFLGDIFDEYGLPYVVMPNIMRMRNVYRDRERLQPHFICIRSMTPPYNIPCILRAYERFKVHHPEASLTLLGDGSERSKLEQFVEDNHIQDVRFVGRVPNEDVYGYLDKSDIMLSSPMVDNMPLSLLEGFSSGLLVISSRVGGVPYMIKDGENGYLFESDNDTELENIMELSIADQERSKSMIKVAYKEMYSYSWSANKDKYYQICRG